MTFRCQPCAVWLLMHDRLPVARCTLFATTLVDMDQDRNDEGVITQHQLGSYHNTADWLARPPYVVGAAHTWSRRLFDRFGPVPDDLVAEDQAMLLRSALQACLSRETFIRDIFAAGNRLDQINIALAAKAVSGPVRLRMFVYPAIPQVLAPAVELHAEHPPGGCAERNRFDRSRQGHTGLASSSWYTAMVARGKCDDRQWGQKRFDLAIHTAQQPASPPQQPDASVRCRGRAIGQTWTAGRRVEGLRNSVEGR